MDAVIGLLLLGAGVLVGFFIGKYFYADQSANQQSSEQAIKQLMAQQANHYVNQSRQAINQLGQQVDALQQQLTEYELLLNQAPEEPGKEKLAYFGEHASAYLRNQQAKHKRASVKAESQPLDFSDGNSGLFVGSENKRLNESD